MFSCSLSTEIRAGLEHPRHACAQIAAKRSTIALHEACAIARAYSSVNVFFASPRSTCFITLPAALRGSASRRSSQCAGTL